MIDNYVFDFVDEPMLEITKYAASIDCKSDKTLNIQKITNSIIDPQCILSKNQILTDFKGININDYEIIDKPVIFLGTWYNVWGHLLTDTLSRFWFVETKDYFEKSLVECDILYYADNDSFPTQFYELLEIIGVDRNRLKLIDKPLYCNELFVPDDSIYVVSNEIISKKDADNKGGGYFYSEEFNSLIGKIKICAPKINQIDKVFFTVPPSAKFIGIKSIETILKKSGFQIVNPANISFKEQLSYICNCNIFATFEGSVSFNALFSNSSTEIVLLRKLPYVVPYQFMINTISYARIIYVDTHASLFCDKNYPYLGPFLLYPSGNLKRYLGVKNPTDKLTLWAFTKYFLHAVKIQIERSSFSNSVVWDIDMYYFLKLNKIIKKGLINRTIMKLINKFGVK